MDGDCRSTRGDLLSEAARSEAGPLDAADGVRVHLDHTGDRSEAGRPRLLVRSVDAEVVGRLVEPDADVTGEAGGARGPGLLVDRVVTRPGRSLQVNGTDDLLVVLLAAVDDDAAGTLGPCFGAVTGSEVPQ